MRDIALISRKIYTNFTRPLVVTVATNLNSDHIMIMVCTALASHKHNHRHTHLKVLESTKELKNTNPASSATIDMCKQKGRFSQGCFLSKAIICLNVIRQNRPYTRNQHFLNTHMLKTLFKNLKYCFRCLFLPKAFFNSWLVISSRPPHIPPIFPITSVTIAFLH